jgi:hypothetical protein
VVASWSLRADMQQILFAWIAFFSSLRSLKPAPPGEARKVGPPPRPHSTGTDWGASTASLQSSSRAAGGRSRRTRTPHIDRERLDHSVKCTGDQGAVDTFSPNLRAVSIEDLPDERRDEEDWRRASCSACFLAFFSATRRRRSASCSRSRCAASPCASAAPSPACVACECTRPALRVRRE